MQAIVLTLLLASTLPAEPAEERHRPALDGLRLRQVLPTGTERADACDVARRIVYQAPCLADGDCPALDLWTRSFGPPRFEPLHPSRAVYRDRRTDRIVVRPDPRRAPGPPAPMAPGAICPAGAAPRQR